MTASEVQEIRIAILERDERIGTLVEENRKYRAGYAISVAERN